MDGCIFCGRSPAPKFALTSCSGDPRSTRSWRKHVSGVCGRCHRLLAQAGRDGLKLKGKDERWYLGYGVGIFESKGAPR